MKYFIVFILCLIKFCISNELKCGRSDSSVESIEFYCENYPETLPDDCTTSFLQWIHMCDKSKVTELKIIGCDPDTIEKIVDEFKNLRSLHIPYSGYKSLDTLRLKHEHLVKFNASHSQIFKIFEWFFQNTPNLTEVDLSYNEIEWSGHIRLPSNMKKVNFAHNKIDDMFTLDGLRDIEYLDLSNNFLSRLSTSEYFPNLKLKTLRLENNKINTLHFSTLMRQGVTVHITWDYVRLFDLKNIDTPIHVIVTNQSEGVFYSSGGEIYLQCSEFNFKEIWRFDVSGKGLNVAELIPCLTSSIEEFDLSNNNVEKLDFFQPFNNLRYMKLINLTLSEFDFMWLKNQNQLQGLHISNNKNLKKMKNVQQLDVATKLYKLYLDGNQLENVAEQIQHMNLPMLLVLDLSGNHVGTLNDTTFQKLKMLNNLNLSNTNLSLINVSPFKVIENLAVLNISNNNIEHLNLTSINGKKLWKLLLNGNNLMELNGLQRTHFPSLQHLQISYNLFPCEYLKELIERIKIEFRNLAMPNRWIQKHGDCTPEN